MKKKLRLKYELKPLGGNYYSFQVLEMDEEFRGAYDFKCKNGWEISSIIEPEICVNGKSIFLRGIDWYDNDIFTFTAIPKQIKQIHEALRDWADNYNWTR